jgi:hypothetical protein
MGLALFSLGRREEALSSFRQAGSIFRASGMLQLAHASARWVARVEKEIATGSSTNVMPQKPVPRY